MGFRSRAFLAGGLGFAVAFVVACGGSTGLLSGDQSSTLNAQLDAVSSALDSHDCGAAQNAVTSLNQAITKLPTSVNTTLLQNLGQGAATVGQLAARQCLGSPSSSSSSSSSSSASTTTTTTTPTVTTTVPATTTASQSSTTPGTATNQPSPGTSSTSNGGAGLGGGGTGTSGNGGAGK